MQATGWCVYNGTAEHTAAIAVLAGDGCGEGGRRRVLPPCSLLTQSGFV